MAKTERELTGRVAIRSLVVAVLPFVRVDTDALEPHLKVLYLEPWAARSAKPGDRVKLAYRSTATRGDWVVTEVLS